VEAPEGKPRKYTEMIARFVREEPGPPSLLDNLDHGRVVVGPNHTVAGNRIVPREGHWRVSRMLNGSTA
jgi:hypothetical protein